LLAQPDSAASTRRRIEVSVEAIFPNGHALTPTEHRTGKRW
jgi:hypothetical protein